MSRLPDFEWNETKNRENSRKHGITFETAQYAFNDPCRIIAIDHQHSTTREQRYFFTDGLMTMLSRYDLPCVTGQ